MARKGVTAHAKAIVSARKDEPITTTSQLAAIIHAVMPAKRPGQIDPATRSFQALRIYINRELDELTDGLSAVESDVGARCHFGSGIFSLT